MIIVTNQTKQPLTRADIEFAPGENRFKDAELSAGKLAQISAHPNLKWVKVEDKPIDKAAKQETK